MQEYNNERSSFAIKRSLISFVFNLMIWIFFIPAWYWKKLDAAQYKLNLCGDTALQNDIIQSILFITTIILLSMVIYIPFDLHFTFSIEEKWGFNKMTY